MRDFLFVVCTLLIMILSLHPYFLPCGLLLCYVFVRCCVKVIALADELYAGHLDLQQDLSLKLLGVLRAFVDVVLFVACFCGVLAGVLSLLPGILLVLLPMGLLSLLPLCLFV